MVNERGCKVPQAKAVRNEVLGEHLTPDHSGGAGQFRPGLMLSGRVNLTPEQVSEILQVPVDTLQAWRTRKNVPLQYFKVGNHVRYPLVHLTRFIAANTQPTT